MLSVEKLVNACSKRRPAQQVFGSISVTSVPRSSAVLTDVSWALAKGMQIECQMCDLGLLFTACLQVIGERVFRNIHEMTWVFLFALLVKL